MKVVIIGNGISGITAARWIRKLSDYDIKVISSESEFFYSRTALMYIYMGHMRQSDTQPYEEWFWKKNRIELNLDHVNNIDFSQKLLKLRSGITENYDKLIIATGSSPNKFGWPGQELEAVHGLYSLQDLEQMEIHSKDLKNAVVVGGGLIGIEMAEMFRSRNIDVTMLVRESSYWNNVLPEEEAEMISRHIRKHHIDLRLGVNLEEIIGDEKGKACAVTIKETGEKVECAYVGLTAGVSPNVDFLKSTKLEIDKGILVDEYLQTNIDDVYAIGDCAQVRNPVEGRRSIEAVWYTGRMMGESVSKNICGNKKPYDPGIWFNSAKFLDIEYQVYGTVLPLPPDNHASVVWQDREKERLIRLVYDSETEDILGFNLLGIRFRHEVCEKWLKEKTNIREVISNLALADFNPEFHNSYEMELINKYRELYGIELKVENQRSSNATIEFLNK
ncbi:MAG: NAD(P)/FAD-dependent oxidoreductase [Bacteroidia bacterium]|nr:NAD(P)/FAD-dependent oxidoreductase [Bacteroidia bacterium]